MPHSNRATLTMQHKTMPHKHSEILNNRTAKRAINSADSKIATSNTEPLKQCCINSEIQNSITSKQCKLK